MKTTKRTQISVEKREVWVVRGQQKVMAALCEACGTQVEMVIAEQAAAMARVSRRDIYRRVESGELHFTETEDGLLYVCLNSLTA